MNSDNLRYVLAVGRRGIVASERLLQRARRVDTEFVALTRELASLDVRLCGSIRLTTAPNLADTCVAPCLARFGNAMCLPGPATWTPWHDWRPRDPAWPSCPRIRSIQD